MNAIDLNCHLIKKAEKKSLLQSQILKFEMYYTYIL